MIRWFWPLIVAGCSANPEPSAWTRSTALSTVRTAMDTNMDGQVDASEYAAHAYAAPPFPSADTNQDGDLSTLELDKLLALQDPTTFDRRPAPTAVDLNRWRKPFAGDPNVRIRRETLVFLLEEARRRAVATPLPDPDTQDRLAEQGGPAFSKTIRRLAADLGPD